MSIPNLRRINIIGGVNGVGKSTVLEAILLMLARTNPLILSRPYMKRQMKMPYPDGFSYLFNDFDTQKIVKFYGKANSGSFDLTLKSQDVHDLQINSPNSNFSNNEISQRISESKGLSLTLTTNNLTLKDEMVYSQPSPDNLGLNIKQGNIARTPFVMLISQSDFNPVEDAQRYSTILKEKRINHLILHLQLLFGDLQALNLLHEGGAPVLYVQFSDGSLVQSMMLGGGFQMMLSVALLMMTVRDGVFLFDEVDSTIHHTLLPQFWGNVSKLAFETNGQVFAVTHSRECIGAAVRGLTNIGRLGDLAYFRLEEQLEDIRSISYTGDELAEALASDWEIR